MDNRLENLEWVTHHENILHMYKLGNDCLTGKKYENNYNSKSILLKNDKGEILRFNCIKLCIEWLQSKYNLKTDNLYAILKKYSMNNIPFYGYRIEYL